jgi:hypothetical protein
MPTYLERYNAGEREQVWDELLALGAAVRDEPLYSDALAVARETMGRARHNVELIVERLREKGYKFSSKEPYKPPPADTDEQIAQLEERVGAIPLSIKVWYEIVGEVKLWGNHSKWSVDGGDGSLFRFFSSKHFVDTKGLQINGIEWQPEVLRFRSGPIEPLRISPESSVQEIKGALHELAKTYATTTEAKFVLAIADDGLYGGNGDTMDVPDPAIDGIVDTEAGSETFVNYLRRNFKWGGFPGFATADEELRRWKESIDKGRYKYFGRRPRFLNFEAGESYVPSEWLAELTEGLLPI